MRRACWVALVLAGCAHAAQLRDLEGRACPGRIEVPEGLKEVEDPALLQSALGRDGQGQLCAGRVYEAVRPVEVHRVWQRSKPWSELGRWWSFGRPGGPVAEFRRAYDDCPEWSELDVHTACTLKVGARVVVGPGQSARCADGSRFEPSPALQVFVPNDARAGRVLVEGCGQAEPWPGQTGALQ